MNQYIRDLICELGHDQAIVFDNPDYDNAIIGITTDGKVVYDYSKMIESLMEQDKMTYLEAVEFIDYNTIRAIPYAGEYAPIIMEKLDFNSDSIPVLLQTKW